MEVRKLTEQEHFESNLVSYVAFHMRMEDPEKVKEESKKLTIEDWGAFSEDGRIMARILNHRFDSMLDGQVVANGGIGGTNSHYGVSRAVTDVHAAGIPEHRRHPEDF